MSTELRTVAPVFLPPISQVAQPHAVDLRPFIPDDWAAQVEAAAELAAPVRKEGGGPGSLGVRGTGLDYRFVGGDQLLDALPWLSETYRVARHLCWLQGDGDLEPIDGPHAVTLNVLPWDSDKDGLEWHLDGSDVERTVIFSPGAWYGPQNGMSVLFGEPTTQRNQAGVGGRFLTHDGNCVGYHSLGTPGVALSVATGITPHAVEPITVRDVDRVTVMLAYTTNARRGTRAPDQSTYIGATS